MATLAQYRAQIATDLGAFVSSTATSGTTTTLVDTTRISSILSSATYDNWFFFRPTAVATDDRLRYVAEYEPTSGTFTPDRSWTNAPTTSEAYELHGFIEPYAAMTDIINRGLKRCFVTAETTITPVALATRHLITASWIDAEWKVRQVGFLSSAEVRAQINPYERVVRGWVSNEASGGWYLNHPGQTFNTTDTLYLWTVSGAYSQCAASGGVYGTQVGLNLESDIARVPLDWLTQAALIEAFERFDNILDRTSNQRMQTDAAKAASRFTTLRTENFQRPQLTFRPLGMLGPLPVGA